MAISQLPAPKPNFEILKEYGNTAPVITLVSSTELPTQSFQSYALLYARYRDNTLWATVPAKPLQRLPSPSSVNPAPCQIGNAYDK